MGACAASRSTFVDGDVRVTSARLSGFVVNELVFPAAYTMEVTQQALPRNRLASPSTG